MKLQAVLDMVDKIKPGNPYDTATKIQWLNELEGDIQSRLLKTAPQEIIQYTEADLEATLLIPVPHDKVYWMWVAAMIDFANGEYQKYQNTLQMVNDAYDKYAKWFHRHFHEDTGGFLYIGGTTKYGLSAYEIAVNHGFVGTEEEWLNSFEKGNPGEDGEDGVGIQSVTYKGTTDAGNVYTITLTDGSAYDFVAPPGPEGPKGQEGPAGSGIDVDYEEETGTVVVTGAEVGGETGGGESGVLTVNVTNSGDTLSADKTYAEIQTAAQAGKLVQARYEGNTYMLGYANPTDTYVDFNHMWGQYLKVLEITKENAVRYVVMAFTTA